MKTTALGRTGLRVSRIAYGTWQLGGDWGSFDEDAAIAAIRHARELGVNVFDTAQAYGFGAAERVLGKALRPELTRDRDGVVIATKGGVVPGGRDASPARLRAGVESSLRALGVETIDLYQVHWPDPSVPIAETAGALQDLADSGKIRHVGVSNYGVEQMEEFAAVRPVETLQPPYHLFRRAVEERVLPYAAEHGVGVLAYSPLASGLLTGRIDEDTTFDEGDWRGGATAFTGDALKRNVAVVRELAAFAEERGMTVSQLAIAWVLARRGVDVAIVGARGSANIEASAAAADVELTAADLAAIDRITEDAVQIEGSTPEGAI
ncbi:aldo/keto reductase [Streptomyces radicis]|uniref:Aldo/keto reductase n=1 Tax=Streptomyces radicis TaxID=1750517 RepID=A0A3A9W7U2_9ACTN|nr:aldo/keto reductase [Streptomyces radicis]RKN09291.1 aldo/keto reductase [Streptomyces radicis]RKN23111.1 aldo/keto reductase [Streptomyces radicis]